MRFLIILPHDRFKVMSSGCSIEVELPEEFFNKPDGRG
jgi:hypothetical protein